MSSEDQKPSLKNIEKRRDNFAEEDTLYVFHTDKIQGLYREAGVLPCNFDASVFVSFEKTTEPRLKDYFE